MRQTDPLETLRQFVGEYQNQKAAAKALGIKPAYLSDLLNQRRGFSQRILDAIGLKQIVVKS